jgi:hypothetical protein
MTDQDKMKGTLILRVVVNVPRASGGGTDQTVAEKALEQPWIEAEIEACRFSCTYSHAQRVSEMWKAKNGGRCTAVWQGMVSL